MGGLPVSDTLFLDIDFGAVSHLDAVYKCEFEMMFRALRREELVDVLPAGPPNWTKDQSVSELGSGRADGICSVETQIRLAAGMEPAPHALFPAQTS